MSGCDADCEHPQLWLEADPDIAGIGVIISFLISAWLTFVLALFGVLFVDGVLDHLEIDVLSETDVWIRDCGLTFTTWMRESPRSSLPGFFKWLKTLFLRAVEDRTRIFQVCLLLSDQQLVAGSSLFIISLSKTCSITDYHYEIAANLAYCSIIAYGSSEELASGAQRGMKSRLWRLFWVTLLYGSLFASRVVWLTERYMVTFADPIVCAWRAVGHGDNYESWDVPVMIILMYYDLFAYFRSSLILVPELLELTIVRAILKTINRLPQLPTVALLAFHRPPAHRQPRRLLSFWFIEGFSNVCQACVRIMLWISITFSEILWSMFASFAISFAYLIFLITAIGPFRRAASESMDGDENEWGFGQMMPMMLLVLPLTTLMETLYPLLPAHDRATTQILTEDTNGSRTTSPPQASTSSLDVPLEDTRLLHRNQTLQLETQHRKTRQRLVLPQPARTLNRRSIPGGAVGSEPTLSIWDKASEYESKVINTVEFRIWLFLVVIALACVYAWYTGMPLEYV